ncbi:MAG: Xaa-Pro peptidase family protein [Planctomycetes bacterium]|nr:Xaa-Pro peptidase family protein [Planctomycetota bacterium]
MLSAESCKGRRQRLMDALGRGETLWLSHPDSLRYLAGFHVDPFSLGNGFGGVLSVEPDGTSTLWHDDRMPDSVGHAHADRRIVVPWYDGKSPARGIRALALPDALPASWPGWFHDQPGRHEIQRRVACALASLRRRKDPDEIALLETCCRAAEAGHAWARRNLQPGMTEMQLYSGISSACSLASSRAVIVYGDFAVSPGPERKGGPATERVIRQGDLVIVDFSVVIFGYRCDFTATLCAGEPCDRQRAMFEVAREGMRRGEQSLRPGTPARDVHAAVFSAFVDAGMPEAFPHHAGHGLGLSHPEAPFFVPGSEDVVLEGDVVTLEPGAYVSGVGGLRIEHNYLVTGSGQVVLSRHHLGP